MKTSEVMDKLKEYLKDAEYQYSISQNDFNEKCGVYFKGKIIAYKQAIHKLEEM